MQKKAVIVYMCTKHTEFINYVYIIFFKKTDAQTVHIILVPGKKKISWGVTINIL